MHFDGLIFGFLCGRPMLFRLSVDLARPSPSDETCAPFSVRLCLLDSEGSIYCFASRLLPNGERNHAKPSLAGDTTKLRVGGSDNCGSLCDGMTQTLRRDRPVCWPDPRPGCQLGSAGSRTVGRGGLVGRQADAAQHAWSALMLAPNPFKAPLEKIVGPCNDVGAPRSRITLASPPSATMHAVIALILPAHSALPSPESCSNTLRIPLSSRMEQTTPY
jgi:hypothetical protein